MEALDRIMSQMKKAPTTSQNIAKYKCVICKDTEWILGENGAQRCECYKKEKMTRLWKRYGVDPNDIKKLNEYNPIDMVQKSAKDKAAKYINDFERIKELRENSYGLFGQAGAGKTHIVNAIGSALINKGVEVIYMPYLEAIRELKANAMDDEWYIKLLDRYQKADVLIIDDLFKDKIKNGKLIERATVTETDMKHIYPIVNFRYLNYLPTLVSSEATPTTLANLDEALAGRLLEPCGDNITIFQNQKYNYRMRKFFKEE